MQKQTRTRETHPISRTHFRKVVNRDAQMQKNLEPVWVLTWNLRGRIFSPLGTNSMMVMSYHPPEGNRPKTVIELLCFTAQPDYAAGCIHYSTVRMSHNFALNPVIGAKGRTLDPRDEGTCCNRGERPNGSWVRLAMEADRQAVKASSQNWKLPVIPDLPKFWAGYSSMSAIDMEITEAMLHAIAAKQGIPVSQVREQSEEQQLEAATAIWPTLWKAPGTADNVTPQWLLPAEYTTKLKEADSLYEDFSELVGVHRWNPARDIKAIQFPNPANELAKDLDVDLFELLQVINRGPNITRETVREADDKPHDCTVEGDVIPDMTATEFSSRYDAAVDNLMRLREALSSALGAYSQHFSVEQLNHFVTNPDEVISFDVQDLSKDVPEEDLVRLMRQRVLEVQPLSSDSVTDADLLAAAQSPDEPLNVSLQAKFQVLRRDIAMTPEDAFRFTPQALDRPGVFANLWAGVGWSPRVPQEDMEPYTEARKPKWGSTKKVTHAIVK